MKLNKQNYYNADANWQYWSTSQFKDFEQCEAAALAKLKGVWKPPKSTTGADPLVLGNLVHSKFESDEAYHEFLESTYEAKTTKDKVVKIKDEICKYGNPEKGIKKDYQKADKMIKALADDPLFKATYVGDREVPVTGEIDGIPWKGKIDCLNLDEGYFCDLKTVDDIHKGHWNNQIKARVNFIVDRQYIMQMAVYRELLRQTYGINLQAFIFAVSKQETPDKLAVKFSDWRYEEALEPVHRLIHRFDAVKNGLEKPDRCEQCDYCRRTKQLNHFVEVGDIDLS